MHKCLSQSNHIAMAGADKSAICPRCGKLYHIGVVRVSVDIEKPDPVVIDPADTNGLTNPDVMPEVNGRGIMAHPTGGMYNSPACWEHSDPLISYQCPACEIECIEVDTSIAKLVAALQRWKFFVKSSSGDTEYNFGSPGAFITLYAQWPAFLLNAMTWGLLPAEAENLRTMASVSRQTKTLFFNDKMVEHIKEYCDKMAAALMDDRNPYIYSLTIYANTVGSYCPSASIAHLSYAIHCIGAEGELVKRDRPKLYAQIAPHITYLASLQSQYPNNDEISNRALVKVAADYGARCVNKPEMPNPVDSSKVIQIVGEKAIIETAECG